MAIAESIMGGIGMAWRFEHAIPAPLDQVNLANWFIDAGWAHPVWNQYLLSLISLKEVEGVPPPFLFDPLATHEVQLWALDPDHEVRVTDVLVADKPIMHVLQPQNFVGQAAFVNDEAAISYVRTVVQGIVKQQLSPDTDHRRDWIKLFPYNPY